MAHGIRHARALGTSIGSVSWTIHRHHRKHRSKAMEKTLDQMFVEVQQKNAALIQARVVTAQTTTAMATAQTANVAAVADENAKHDDLTASITAFEAALDALEK